jgi:dCTP deaminase
VTLSDRDIRWALTNGEIGLAPFVESQLQPASYDVRLGANFLIPANVAYGERISIARSHGRFPRMTQYPDVSSGVRFTEKGNLMVLNPGQFCLGTTLEYVSLNARVIAKLDGKSTLGRIGLIVHCTAGYIDPGFQGQVTLELFNCAPYAIELVAGEPIGQLRFERLSSSCERPYGSTDLHSHYQGQTGATPPKL